MGICGSRPFNYPDLVRLILTTRNLQRKRKWKAIKRSLVIQALQLTALFVGSAIYQKKRPHTSCVHVRACVRACVRVCVCVCVCVCVALAEFRFRHVRKYFWNQATMMKFCYIRYCTLSEAQDYWRNQADGHAEQIRKRSRCNGRLVSPPHSYSYASQKYAGTGLENAKLAFTKVLYEKVGS
jgi:hypothetical protein